MGEPVQFTPAELDRIEDALEGLEHVDAVDDASPDVQARLQSYRTILQLSREAMPLQEVPSGVLADVLAQAREAAETPSLRPHDPAPPKSWWARWRRTLLIPGLAVAATAALVLIIVTPASAPESEPMGADDSIVAQREAPEGTAELEKAEAPPPPPPAAAAPSSTPVEEAEGELDAAIDLPADEAKPSADKPAEAPPAELDGKDSPRWDIVARGDRARRDGQCDQARSEYALALADEDDRVRARAYAGLGLCDAEEAKAKSAAEHYARAQKLDPEVGAFIEDERPQGSMGAPRATKAKRKARKVPPKKAAPPPKADDLPNAQQAFEK